MTELYRFTTGAEKTLVTDEFLVTDLEYDESRLREFRTGTGFEADLDKLGRVLDWVQEVDDYEDHSDKSELDAVVAPAVRKYIDIPAQAAADARIWHYLAVGWRPDYVRYRWPPDTADRTKNSMREKFTVSTEDLYTPAIGRLWFMAEFTRQGDDYSTTEKLLNRQWATNRLFDRKDLRDPGVVRAFANVAYDEDDSEFIDNGDVFEETAQAVSHDLSTYSNESLGADKLEKIVRDNFEQVRS